MTCLAMFFFSERCVHKEWIYHCIIQGEIVHPSFYHEEVVRESDSESTIFSVDNTTSVKQGIHVQPSRSQPTSKKRTQKKTMLSLL